MSKKLYVGSLPYSVTETQLRELFQSYNPLEVRLISDKFTGRSKGFGFVEVDDENASRAIEDMHGKDIEGRTLVVNEARPLQPREGGFGGGGGGGFGGGRGGRGGRPGGGRDRRGSGGGGGRDRW